MKQTIELRKINIIQIFVTNSYQTFVRSLLATRLAQPFWHSNSVSKLIREKNIFRMSDQENEGMEQDIEEPVDDLGTDEPTVITSGEAPDDADSDDETGKAVPKDKRITVST